jgi:hypothetical protein
MPQVVALRAEDVNEAARVIAAAFLDDPLVVHMLSDDVARRRLAPPHFAPSSVPG